jgi:hypothetical protein
MEPDEVAAAALAALPRGPTAVAGLLNRTAAILLGRILPRRLAVRLMGAATRRLYGDGEVR